MARAARKWAARRPFLAISTARLQRAAGASQPKPAMEARSLRSTLRTFRMKRGSKINTSAGISVSVASALVTIMMATYAPSCLQSAKFDARSVA